MTEAGWKRALPEAVFIFLFISSLFYFWFGVADRYAIFLYGHTATGIPTTQPFDEITISRYWMAGLVASGAVMVIYTTYNLAQGIVHRRRLRTYRPPPWWQVWVICALPLSASISLITLFVNAPTLPPALAAMCVAATLAGLALGLTPGLWAAQRPLDLAWLIVDAAGLMPIFLLLRAIELPGRGLSISLPVALLFAFGGIAAGIVWLGVMTGLRLWRHKSFPDGRALFMAGVCLSYLLLPLVHHVLTPPAYRYISTASNFFAFNLGLQSVIFGAGAGLALGIARLRRGMLGRRLGGPAKLGEKAIYEGVAR